MIRIKSNEITSVSVMRKCSLWCVFVSLIIITTQAYASTGKKNSFDQLLSAADMVVLGTTVSVSSEWRKTKIYTIATIKVDELVKGKAASEIQVEYLGGTANHPTLNVPIAMNVSNGVAIAKGDEAVFLLKNIAGSRYQIIGTSRGKISVLTDKTTGVKQVQSGIKRIQAKPSKKDEGSVISGEQMNLEEFLNFIRSRMQLEKRRSKQ